MIPRITILLILLLLTLYLPLGNLFASENNASELYTELLKKYVRADGILYPTWKNSPEDLEKLDSYIAHITTSSLKNKTPSQKKAFYINAYNAWTLKLVLDRYPIKSVRPWGVNFTFFSLPHINVAGKKMSLDHLEKQLLLKNFPDPRLHFAINCASQSCPPLLASPYTAENIDRQLDQVTSHWLTHSPDAIQIKADKILLSEIFNWYATDFKSAGGSIAFINRYRKEKIPPPSKIEWIPYDWTLNISPEK